MLIFKLQARDGHINRLFTGFHIDQSSDLLVTLAALGKGVSRSELFRSIIDDWSIKNGYTENHLSKMIADRAFTIFKYKNDYEGTISKSDFCKHLKLDLVKKKIPDTLVELILDKFNAKIK